VVLGMIFDEINFFGAITVVAIGFFIIGWNLARDKYRESSK
jgi:hypothetical protein